MKTNSNFQDLFECSTCGKTFNRRQRLKNHILGIHQGIKPQQCPLCTCSYVRKSNLAAHVARVHKERHNSHELKGQGEPNQTKLHKQMRNPVESLSGIESNRLMSRADRKSQVSQCLGFCRADFWSLLAYKSAKQKPEHCLT